MGNGTINTSYLQKNLDRKKVVALFNGTMLSKTKGMVGWLGQALTDKFQDKDDQFKLLSFDGCAVGEGFFKVARGYVFGHGVAEMADQVVADCIKFAEKGEDVDCCLFGFSRGGISALLVANKLADLPKKTRDRIHVKMVLFDPVPGNLRITPLLDALGVSLTEAVSVIKGLRCNDDETVCIYFAEKGEGPLTAAFMAPVLPVFEGGLVPEIIAMPGEHGFAQNPSSIYAKTITNKIKQVWDLSFDLPEVRTGNTGRSRDELKLEELQKDPCGQLADRFIEEDTPDQVSIRLMHGLKAVTTTEGPNIKYSNDVAREQKNDPDRETVKCKVIESTSWISHIHHFQIKHSKKALLLEWLLGGGILTAVFYATVNHLANLPMLVNQALTPMFWSLIIGFGVMGCFGISTGVFTKCDLVMSLWLQEAH